MQFKIGRKLIGTLENGVFYKEAMKSKHLFRVLDAFGVDSATLHKLPQGCKIEIHELEENKWYRTTKEEFLSLGETYLHFEQPQEDYRAQLFLRRHHFRVENPPELTKEQKEENEYRISQGLQKRWL
mgnify:FL=1